MQERIGRLSPFLDVIKYYVDDGDKGDIKNRDKKEITVFLSLLSYLDCSLQKKKELLLEIEKYLPIVYKDEDGFRL
ncbi:MAG: hypothetical protein LBD11_00455 [Candidatus Peribacteria bacterium]|jgi:hypothetical protein|nr:hypothetical protein [Candidatus Peribacteria bacterium]